MAADIAVRTTVTREMPYVDLRLCPDLQIENAAAVRALAQGIRYDVINSTARAGCGHPGGSLSKADMLAVLYGNHLRFDPCDSLSLLRDRFVMSTGHCAPAQYSVLSFADFFPREDLLGLRQIGSHLSGHPEYGKTPGVDFSTGRLGVGFAGAAGMAIAAKMDGLPFRVYASLGDGEIQEGIVAETARVAGALRLNNLVAFLDNNGLQINGPTSRVSAVDYMLNWISNGWQVIEVDGHHLGQLDTAIRLAGASEEMPTLILMNTHKGMGVDFMTDVADYHGKATKGDDTARALGQIGDIKQLEEEAASVICDMRDRRIEGAFELNPFTQIAIDPRSWGLSQATRETFGRFVVEAMRQNPRIVCLDADLLKSDMLVYAANEFGLFNTDPNGRTIDVGIGEGAMFGIGAGLSTCGFLPVMSTFGVFTEVGADIIRQTFVRMKLAAVIAGTHAGGQVAEDGPSHMDLTSLDVMRAAQVRRVYEPGGSYTAARLLTDAVNSQQDAPGPRYFRFTRSPISEQAFEGIEVDPNKGYRTLDLTPEKPAQRHITIVASGAMLEKAVEVAKIINRSEGSNAVTRIVDAFSPTNFADHSKHDTKILDGADIVATMIDATPETLGEPVLAYLGGTGQHSTVLQFGLTYDTARTGKIDDVYRHAGLAPQQIADKILGSN